MQEADHGLACLCLAGNAPPGADWVPSGPTTHHVEPQYNLPGFMNSKIITCWSCPSLSGHAIFVHNASSAVLDGHVV